MGSPVDICNQALLAIGAQAQISSINPSDGSTEANACSMIYPTQINALHRAAHWNFARAQIALTQLKAYEINGTLSSNPPPTPWRYEYAYPSDCLQLRYLFITPPQANQTSTTVGISGWQKPGPQMFIEGRDFDATGNPIKVILTNAPMAQAVYTAYVGQVDLWDPHFYTAAVATLAAWLVNPLSRNRSLMNDQFNIAKSIIEQARISDGNEGLTIQDHIPDWLQVRGRGSGWADDAFFWGGWQAMSFPGGFTV